MAICQSSVKRLYQSVIEDVIQNVRDSFFDEGVDEQVLMELKQMWESKLSSLKALEPLPESSEPQPPSLSTHSHARQAANSKNSAATAVTTSIPHQTAGGAIVKKVMDNARGNAVSAATAASAAANAATTASMPSSSNTTVSAPPPALPLNPAPVTTATLPPELGRMVPIQITLPPTPGSGETQPRVLNIQVPAAALQGNQLHSILSGPIMTATLALPAHVASSLLQQHITAAFAGQAAATGRFVQAQRNVPAQAPAQQVAQLDGVGDSSDDDLDDDIDDDDDDDDVDDDKEDSAGEDSGGQEEEPLNSGDDVSDEDVAEQFETDNVVVCQYDKVTRSRNKWKLYLKDGIMNLNGRDFVFQKANGDAEW